MVSLSFMRLSRIWQASLILGIGAGVYGANPGITKRERMEEAEHILVDNDGTNKAGFFDVISPCGHLVNVDAKEQPTAQWVRLAFHDAINFDKNAVTGGLDASIAFETFNFINQGAFVTDTLNFFLPFVNVYLSMADMIAIGVKTAMSKCGSGRVVGDNINLFVGRVDATQPGPVVVPEPSTDIDTTFSRFDNAGFSHADAIKLTACGHSIGRVHAASFPSVLPNVQGALPFDSTPGAFDSRVINEYVNWNGHFGGPLVTSSNVIERSDFRLYQSDGNATVRSLNSDNTFFSECAIVLQRLINVVPRGVDLSPAVQPMSWKAINLHFTIDSSGSVGMIGKIRVLGNTPSSINFRYTHVNRQSRIFKSVAAPTGGQSIYGSLAFYPISFLLPPNAITSPSSTGTIAFGDISYAVTPSIFIVAAQSSATSSGIKVVAAVLTSMGGSAIIAHIHLPERMAGTDLNNRITDVSLQMQQIPGAAWGQYTLFTATVEADGTKNVVVQVEQQGGVWSECLKVGLFKH